MEIRRSDMLKWAQGTQLSAENNESPAAGKAAPTQAERANAVSVDSLRSKILSLQQEIRELQTGISLRQVQLGFLNQVNEGSSWQKELRRFMNENFPGVELSLNAEQNLDEFRMQATQVVNNLRNNLIKKEIQIDILSAGIFEPESDKAEEPAVDNSKIVKDFSESQTIFSKLRPDSVRSLVN